MRRSPLRRAIRVTLFAALIAPPAHAVCTQPSLFEAPQRITTGPNPLFMVVEDFNEDGLSDLAVTNSDHPNSGAASSVAILLGTGPREFAAPVLHTLPTGSFPIGLVAADFDEDGILDLASANWGSQNVSILRGLGSGGIGNGSFAAPVQYPAGGRPFQVAAADFDEDGILDLAVSLNSVAAVSVLRGQGSGGVGTGTFGAPALFPLGNLSTGLEVADFDEDGILDLVATENYSGTVAVLRGGGAGGVGNGTFGPAAHYPAGPEPFNVAVEDFNDDGIADLAVVSIASGGTAVLLGNGVGGIGDGTFGPPSFLPSGNSGGVVTPDLDGDGINDLVVSANPGFDPGAIEVYLGQGSGGVGNGAFLHFATLTIGASPYQLTAADIDGDGHIDILASALYHDFVGLLFGTCGADPQSPVLTGVRDVPNDQGGKVFVTWTASSLDVTGGAVNGYRVWRRIPPAAALARRASGPPLHLSRSVRPDGVTDVTYWEALVTLPAQRLPGYGYTAPTTQDSMRRSNPYTAFFISALTADIDVFYSSNVDSGYSVDNIRPRRPDLLAGRVVEGPAYALTWEAPEDPDVVAYRIYRGPASEPDFSQAEPIASVSGTEYTDEGGTGGSYYWVAAIDAHDNEGEPAMLEPQAPTSVVPGLPALALRGASPNPSRSGAFSISFTLPDQRPARITVLDVAGRLVTTLDPPAIAGVQSIPVGSDRKLAPGVYLIRLAHGGRTLEAKAVVAR